MANARQVTAVSDPGEDRDGRSGAATCPGALPRPRPRLLALHPAPVLSRPSDALGYLHDLRHQVATVMMLAAALDAQVGAAAGSRTLAGHLIAESRRLDELIAAMAPGCTATVAGPPPTVRLDELLRGVTEPFRAVGGPELRVLVAAAVVRHDHVPLWRALRNLLDNARTAAGPAGHVDVRLFTRAGFAIVDVEDDGPGLQPGPIRGDARGLTIAETLARGWGGRLELATGRLAGCRARMFVPLWRGVAEAG